MNDVMTKNEFSQSLLRLNLSPPEAAQILSVTPRTIRRWLDDEEISGPAEQAIRAWIRLHDRHLPWRPDSVSVIENDQDQIERHRLHTVNFDAILSRVERRGSGRLPWVVDWDQGRATLGPMEVGFYKLPDGGFSLSTYRRSDGDPDVNRDAELIEEAIYCIAQVMKKQNPEFGPVTLVVHEDPVKGRTASQRLEKFPTLRDAIRRACQKLGTPNFHEPFIASEGLGELLWDHHQLRRICERSITAPPALEAVAAYVKQHSGMFVRTGPAMLGPAESEQRRRHIGNIGEKISDLAKAGRDGLVSYQEFDTLLGALHAAGFFPDGKLVSGVAQALVG